MSLGRVDFNKAAQFDIPIEGLFIKQAGNRPELIAES